MKDDLLKTKEKLLLAIKEQGLTTFLGAYPSESVPEIHWNSDLEPDPAVFVSTAKSLGAQVIYVNWVVFSEDELEEASVEQLEGSDDPSAREHKETVSEFKRYIGTVASVRAGFFLHGVFHAFEREAEWYEEFGMLIAEDEPDELSEHRREPELSEEALGWANKLASDPKFGSLKGWDEQCYLLSKLAGDESKRLAVSDIVRHARTIYNVELREKDEQALVERIRDLRAKGLSLVAIAGKTGLSRERVSMLLAKLEE
ncbi:MAG: hypothetical protein HY237_13950 [Acidobacteria bacterium]|nr:hypothetical protein [Acidobacteriota bacterium]